MTDQQPTGVERDRQILDEAQSKGTLTTLGAFVRLSGPGWLQSAITLGGGSLAGALFLGILGGTSMLWLQLVAIIMGVVMLSAISYVTLSTGERPFGLINQHVNPVLGWGWLVATCMANIIWCMPQFGLAFAAIQKNLGPALVGETVQDSDSWKYGISIVLLILASGILMLNIRGGKAAKGFDLFLKALIGAVVLCFFGVVIKLSLEGVINWSQVFSGFIPDFSQANEPAGDLAAIVDKLPSEQQKFWEAKLVTSQRDVMIGAAATAVGINMTFLMPYSLLQRGWDKTFRGLARFDLSTGMAIPYVLVTSCVVIAASQAFHGKRAFEGESDKKFLSTDAAVFIESPLYGGAEANLLQRVDPEADYQKFKKLPKEEKMPAVEKMAALGDQEKLLAASLVKRNAFSLSQALEPLLGKGTANLVFGLGVFGMGFSTIIILMMINGFAFREAFGAPNSNAVFLLGCLIAGVCGVMWPVIWKDNAQMWLAIFASSFGAMFLPIAYTTFLMLMNNANVLGDNRPTGASRIIWNLLMIISVVGAFAAAGTSIFNKVTNPDPNQAFAGKVALGLSLAYFAAVVLYFVIKPKRSPATN